MAAQFRARNAATNGAGNAEAAEDAPDGSGRTVDREEQRRRRMGRCEVRGERGEIGEHDNRTRVAHR